MRQATASEFSVLTEDAITSDGMTPFVLLARVTVKPGKLEN